MKTDRLLSVVIYLLNHDTVSAKKFAKRFEVSNLKISIGYCGPVCVLYSYEECPG